MSWIDLVAPVRLREGLLEIQITYSDDDQSIQQLSWRNLTAKQIELRIWDGPAPLIRLAIEPQMVGVLPFPAGYAVVTYPDEDGDQYILPERLTYAIQVR